MAVFPANSVGIEDNSGESPSLSDEECESSSESEVDRREYVREQRQVRSRQLREAIGRARGRRRGQGAVKAKGRRGGNRGARIQDGGQQYVWLEENTRRNLKQLQMLLDQQDEVRGGRQVLLSTLNCFLTTICGICY